VDISFKSLSAAVPESYDTYDSGVLSRQQRKRFRVANRYKRDKLREEVLSGMKDVADEFETDIELKSIRSVYTAVANYIKILGFLSTMVIRILSLHWRQMG